MSGEDDLADLDEHNFVPCVAWVRRGVAKPEPDRVKLNRDELASLIEQTKSNLIDEEEEGEETEDATEEASMADTEPVSAGNDPNKTEEQNLIDKYGLENYDDDDGGEQSVKTLLNLGDMACFADPRDDPLMDDIIDQDDEEDNDDFLIRGTDNLVVVGKVEKETSSLEVYVYNDVEDVFYVHHDILLPSIPLALEWLSFDPESDKKGNMVAVSTMLSQIQVWDLDIVDCLEPAYTLGVKPSKKKGIKRIGHKDAVISLAWNRLADHVLASGSVDETVMIWDLSQQNVASTLKYHEEKVQSLAWHPLDQQTLATGCCDKFVRVADCRTENSHKKWKVTGEVEKLLWNHFNPYQCIVSTDAGTVHAIDVRKDSLLWTLSAHTEGVTGLSLSSQCPGCLVTSSADKFVKVWDIMRDKPDCVMEQQLPLGYLQCLSGCPDAPFVVVAGGDNPCNNLKVFDIREGKGVRQRFGKRKLENPLNFSSFGYETANEAEPAETMEPEAEAVTELNRMSLQPKHNIVTLGGPKPHSGGAASKFNKKKKNKKR